MKKILSIGIILFVFTWILSIGFVIVRHAFTSGVSNGQLIADITSARYYTSLSTIPFVHLNKAAADRLQPQSQLSENDIDYISEVPVSGPSSTATSTDMANGSLTTSSDISMVLNDQSLEIIAASLANLGTPATSTTSTTTP